MVNSTASYHPGYRLLDDSYSSIQQTKKLKDFTTWVNSILELGWDYDFIPRLPQLVKLSEACESFHMLYKGVVKPISLTQDWLGKDPIYRKNTDIVFLVSKVARSVSDVFKWIGFWVWLGCIGTSGFAWVNPHMLLILTTCSVVSSVAKGIMAWRHTHGYRAQNWGKVKNWVEEKGPFPFQTTWQIIGDATHNFKDMEAAISSNIGKKEVPQEVTDDLKAWKNEINRRVKPLFGLKGVNYDDAIKSCEELLGKREYSQKAAKDSPLIALARQATEEALIILKVKRNRHEDRQDLAKMLKDKYNWKHLANYELGKQVAEAMLGFVAVGAMVYADQTYKLFNLYRLAKKTLTIGSHVFATMWPTTVQESTPKILSAESKEETIAPTHEPAEAEVPIKYSQIEPAEPNE